ncbi:MAG: glutathione S-transferase N-terminal domain-containing protein [Pseudomonadota bacterium]
MTHYRLYYAPGACSLAAHIALEEIRLAGLADYASTRLVLPQGDQKKPEFLAINPRGHVPVLSYRLDGQEGVLTENLATLQFLVQQHPEARLLPAGTAAQAKAWEWLSWLATDVHSFAFMMVFYPARFAESLTAQAEVEAKGRALLAQHWADLESRLPPEGFVFGEFSLVDAMLIVFYRWAKRYGFAPQKNCPRWSRLSEQTMARASVQATFEDERINLTDRLPPRPAHLLQISDGAME